MMNLKDEPQTFLGFDFGRKSIGIAVGQSVTRTAKPLGIVHAEDGVPHWYEIEAFIQKWHPDAFVVGIPLNMDGTDQELTVEARAFAALLQEHFSLPVYQADERLTTKEARAQLFEREGYSALKKENVDAVAAQLILESFMHNATQSSWP